MDIGGGVEADAGVAMSDVVPGKELLAEVAGVLPATELGGKSGRNLRVLNWASEYGMSLLTWRREWLLVTPRSASSRAIGLEAVEEPLSAWTVR